MRKDVKQQYYPHINEENLRLQSRNTALTEENTALTGENTILHNQLTDTTTKFQTFAKESNNAVADILNMEITGANYTLIKSQNDLLQKNLQKTDDGKLTENQRAVFQSTKTNGVISIANTLFWIYYVIAVLFAGALFLWRPTLSIFMKIVIIFFFLVFPYIIGTIEYWLFFVYYYISSFVRQTPYNQII